MEPMPDTTLSSRWWLRDVMCSRGCAVIRPFMTCRPLARSGLTANTLPDAPGSMATNTKPQPAATLGEWRSVTLRLYGQWATLKLKTRVVLQRTLGVKMRLVAVQWEDRPLVFLFCTDTRMTPEVIVCAYCA